MEHLNEIALFVQVVECGSFSVAAERLDLSRSAVSKAVSRLEQRLGARLLHRTTRRLSLTDAGRSFYQRSRLALGGLEEAVRELGSQQDEPRGTLRISAPVYFGVHHVTPVLTEFLARHPALAADVQLDDRRVDIVADGFDLAVRVGELHDSTLVGRRLAPCRQVICASPDYWRRRGLAMRPEDLAAHDCFTYSYLSSPGSWSFVGPDGRRSTVHVSGRLRFNNTEMARYAALQGLGVIQLPTFYVGEDLRAQRLQAVLQDYRSVQDAAIHALYPTRGYLPPKVRLFIDLLVERFGPQPYWDEF